MKVLGLPILDELANGLKICPHCKSDAVEMRNRVLQFRDIQLPYHYVACFECGARGGVGVNQQEAAEKWNRRKK